MNLSRTIFISTNEGLLSSVHGGKGETTVRLDSETGNKQLPVTLPRVIIESSVKFVHLSIRFINKGQTVIYSSNRV